MKMRLDVSDRIGVPMPGGVSLVVGQTLLVGRSVNFPVDIALPSNAVGRRHCEIGRTACGAWVRDLDSRNGTFLEEKRCLPRSVYPFRPGEHLTISDIVISLVGDMKVNRSWEGGEPGLVERLARCVRDDGDFGTIPILADALEDAGCTDAAILDHLRGPNGHARGCWVLEAILGRDDPDGPPSGPLVEGDPTIILHIVQEWRPGSGRYVLGPTSTFRGPLARYWNHVRDSGFRPLLDWELHPLQGQVEGLRGRLLGWEAKDGRILYECAEESS